MINKKIGFIGSFEKHSILRGMPYLNTICDLSSYTSILICEI